MDISTATLLMVGAIFALLVTGLPLAFITGLVAMAFTFGWFGGAAAGHQPLGLSPSIRWWQCPCSC